MTTVEQCRCTSAERHAVHNQLHQKLSPITEKVCIGLQRRLRRHKSVYEVPTGYSSLTLFDIWRRTAFIREQLLAVCQTLRPASRFDRVTGARSPWVSV